MVCDTIVEELGQYKLWYTNNTINHVFEMISVNVISTTNRQGNHHEALEIIYCE